MNQDKTWHAGRPQPWPHCVRLGPAPLRQKGRAHQFSAHICCSQMAGWIKIPLGREVGLGPGHIVLHGDPALPPQKGHSPPNFCPYCGQTTGWIKVALGMEVSLGPGHIVLDRDPAPLPKKGHTPNFQPISIVAKRLDGSR